MDEHYECFQIWNRRNTGLHGGELQSEDTAVLADASDKRAKTEETLDATTQTTISVLPAGGLGYKLARGKSVETNDVAWEAVDILPVGKIGKGVKTLEKRVKTSG